MKKLFSQSAERKKTIERIKKERKEEGKEFRSISVVGRVLRPQGHLLWTMRAAQVSVWLLYLFIFFGNVLQKKAFKPTN